MTTTNDKPIDTIRASSLEPTIWRNVGEGGSFYSVTFARTRQNDPGEYPDSDSFTSSQPLRVARVGSLACNRIAELRSADRQQSA